MAAPTCVSPSSRCLRAKVGAILHMEKAHRQRDEELGSLVAIAALFDDALDLPVRVALGRRFALVEEFLATCQAELDLGAPSFEVDVERHERQAFGLEFPEQAADF